MRMAASIVCLLSASVCLSGVSFGADWPTYLRDNARSGSTDESLKLPLGQRWIYSSPSAPRRAWSGPEGRTVEGKELRDRVKFDDALQVAVVGGRIYFGSSVDHQLHCMDTQTGKELWSFFTGAPIRLAPTVVNGRVYVGSDDGYAYCLDAKNGRLAWKLRLGPAAEWFIGRGEMISRWPVRTGILVDGGIAYFGVGIFPHENVYVSAVNAADGKIIWRNDHISHMDAGRNDLSPQGYLLATADRLFIPSSRSRPRTIDRETGQLSGGSSTSLKFTQTIIAGTDALIADGRLHSYSLGTRLAAAGDSSYAATGSQVMRMNRKEFAAASSNRSRIASQMRALSRKLRGAGNKADVIKQQIAELKKQSKATENDGIVWKTPSSAEAALIVAGNIVFAGEKGAVTAFDAAKGNQVWKVDVDGDARGLAVANGNLFVSTTTGKIYCFANGASPSQGSVAKPGENFVKSPFPKDKWTRMYEQAAEQILKHPNVSRGFCLIVGSENGRLAYELAKRSELKIYGVEPDEQKIQASRRALSAAGVYGSRITVHQGDLSAIAYSNYFANLIVSDRALLSGRIPGSPAELARHLKPAGGVVVLGQPEKSPGATIARADSQDWLKRTNLGKQGTIRSSGSWLSLTRGTLPGAGNWSHQYGEPGNTASSGDKLVKGGLGVLWYGDPGPDRMVNRHQGAVGPLVVNGRMFIQGTDSLLAYDTYNGLFLWEHANPKAVRTGVFQNRTPGNLAASGDSLFHMVRDKVIQHDAATGKIKATHGLPSGVDAKTHAWGYVAFRDGLLFGTATVREVIERQRRRRGNPGTAATDAIFAIDTKTGKHLWMHQGKSIAHQTIALGKDRVFFIDSTITSEQRADILAQDKTELKELTGEAAKRAEERMKKLDVRRTVALDARTGKTVWSKPVDVTDCSDIGIGGGKLTLMQVDDVLILGGANANGHYWRQFVSGEFKRRRLVALSAKDGYKLWSKDANYRHRPIIIGSRVIAEPWAFDLASGEQQMRAHPLTGKEVPWSIMRPGHHCGMLTGCDNMLLFRSGFTGFYDLKADAGTRHFAGHRLGCWINAIPTNGLVVIPEASAGCVCMFSIASTIVLEPREERRPWTLYSGVGATTPVKQMALNFGAPGDRRDDRGKLWLAYPRLIPNRGLNTSLDLSFKLDIKFLPGGRFFSNDGDAAESSSSELAWVASSGGRGLTRCTIPLLGKDDKPATYTVRLFFSAAGNDKPAQRVFDVRMQGKTVLKNVDAAEQPEKEPMLLVREINDVAVTDTLVIDLVPKVQKSDTAQMPILSGIELRRTDPVK